MGFGKGRCIGLGGGRTFFTGDLGATLLTGGGVGLGLGSTFLGTGLGLGVGFGGGGGSGATGSGGGGGVGSGSGAGGSGSEMGSGVGGAGSGVGEGRVAGGSTSSKRCSGSSFFSGIARKPAVSRKTTCRMTAVVRLLLGFEYGVLFIRGGGWGGNLKRDLGLSHSCRVPRLIFVSFCSFT